MHKFRPKTNVLLFLLSCFVSPYLNGFWMTKFENYHFWWWKCEKSYLFLHFTFQQCIKLYLWQFFFLIFELILTIVQHTLIVTWWIVWWYQIRHKHYIVKQSMKKTKSLIAILQKRFFFLERKPCKLSLLIGT